MEFNFVVLILSIAIGICLIPLRYWVYDKCYDRDTDDFKLFILFCDIIKDFIFIYFLLFYLLYGFSIISK